MSFPFTPRERVIAELLDEAAERIDNPDHAAEQPIATLRAEIEQALQTMAGGVTIHAEAIDYWWRAGFGLRLTAIAGDATVYETREWFSTEADRDRAIAKARAQALAVNEFGRLERKLADEKERHGRTFLELKNAQTRYANLASGLRGCIDAAAELAKVKAERDELAAQLAAIRDARARALRAGRDSKGRYAPRKAEA